MKKLLSIVFVALLAGQAWAGELTGPIGSGSGGGGLSISGTPGDFVIIGPGSTGIQDSANVSFATLPVGLQSTDSPTFATSAGVIATLGSITGGSSYALGTNILSLGAITAGSSYTAGVYNGVALTGGTGTGATANIIVGSAGTVVSVALVNNGTGYLGADTLSAAAASIGGTGSGFSIPVGSVGYAAASLTGGSGTGATANIVTNGSAVTSVTLKNHGTGYAVSNTLSATIGGGSGFSIPVAKVGAISGASTNAQNFTSTLISGVSSDTGTAIFNNFLINADTVDASLAANGAVAWDWNLNTGGGRGGRIAGQYILNLNVAPLDVGQNYVALGSVAQASVSMGGTAGTGNGKGDIFGFNPYCRFLAGATNARQCVGQETDMSLRFGASAEQMIGHQIVQDASSVVAASVLGVAYSANNASGATGWDYLLTDGSYDGNPSLKSTGSIFGCYPHANSGNCGTIGSAFDLNNYSTVSNFILRGPGANGSIDGSFNITAPRITVTGSVAPANGLYLGAASIVSVEAGSVNIGNFGITTNSTPYFMVSSTPGSAPLLPTDAFEIRANNNGLATAHIRQASAGTAAQAQLMFSNNTSTTQAGITLNSGAFSGGQGANALQIFNTSTAPIVIGTGTEILKLGSSGMFTADASTTACVGTLGPAGIHATVQKWLTITDSGGTVGYIPVC